MFYTVTIRAGHHFDAAQTMPPRREIEYCSPRLHHRHFPVVAPRTGQSRLSDRKTARHDRSDVGSSIVCVSGGVCNRASGQRDVSTCIFRAGSTENSDRVCPGRGFIAIVVGFDRWAIVACLPVKLSRDYREAEQQHLNRFFTNKTRLPCSATRAR